MTPARFAAMGCPVEVAGADPASLRAIRRLFADREATFSRFRADSELAFVNARCGRPTAVSPVFAAGLRAALRVAAVTGGLVTPTVAGALLAAGYDRDFDALADTRPAPPQPPAMVNWRRIRLTGQLLELPPGCRLDLNGVVKAMAVDAAVALLPGAGWVSAGGDLATRGPVDVALPSGGAVRLVSGGIATSGRSRRRWRAGGAWQHHLIDATSGRPADSPWQQVTACGAGCLDADAAAKAGFLAGRNGPAWLDRRGIPGRFLSDAGIVENACWAAAMAEPACT